MCGVAALAEGLKERKLIRRRTRSISQTVVLLLEDFFFQESGRECERTLENEGFRESRERCLIRTLLGGATFSLSLLTCADLYANSQTWRG